MPAGTTAGRSVYVHSIKLEEGNKITAWSPAPSDDVKGSEIGTKIEQNAESVRVAWNNFSQFIQMQILNGNASLVIKDDNNNILMSLDKTGQHFYNNNNQIANIGLSEKENTKYVSFGVNGESGKATNAGFAWGINMKEGGFLPIFWMDSYYYVANSGVMTGKFTIAGILDVIGKMGVNGGFYLNGDIGVFFIEGENERRYFEIYSTDIEDNSGFAFFDGHGHSYFQGYKRDGQDVYFMNFNNNDAVSIRNCRAQEFINESKKEIKDKIKKANNNAIEIVKNSNIYEYELKSESENKKHYGFVIDEEKNDVPEQILSTNKLESYTGTK